MSLMIQMAKACQPLRPSDMGDPGFLSFLKNTALKAASAVLPFSVPSTRPLPPTYGPQVQNGNRYPVAVRRPGPLAAVQRVLPGGETGLGEGCGRGFHPNKSSYWLKDGTHVEKGTRCVRNRRRYNPANARATSRSIGRVNAAKAMQGELSEISTGKYTSSGKRRDSRRCR